MDNVAELPSKHSIFDREGLLAQYEAFKKKGLKLDLTRGKPSVEQVSLSSALLELPGREDYLAEGNVDCRNYGNLQGLIEVRKLFSNIIGAPPEQIVASNNSSLALMHDVVTFSLLTGACDSNTPWLAGGRVAFLCPVPGYDRHFTICSAYGIEMLPVSMTDDGPDMSEVEGLVATDDAIKGMWCVPKYSNPTGAIYSEGVIQRLAAMKAAAPDFRLFWDNAYCVHHLTSERVEIANILDICAMHGNPNRPFVFSSTSKITMPGAGVALFASSKPNVQWLLKKLIPRTIGPDKLNQLRHVRFLRDETGIFELMAQHRDLIYPKFQKVIEVFREYLHGQPGVQWTKPKGGYFISLEVPEGCAKLVVKLAKEAGVELTPAGAMYPHGHDPNDRTIRIAPTFPGLREVAEAAQGVAISVLVAVAERYPERFTTSTTAV